MKSKDQIIIRGAKCHNLKNVNVTIPKNKLVVISGLSGSGKSSLAFDTIYAEGQRRYVESLSAYARQFLGQLQKPDVEHIEGLSPAIALEQRVISGSPRSIVGTQTEIYDYLRLLYARVGTVYCVNCHVPISSVTPQHVIDTVSAYPEQTKIVVCAPLVKGRKGEYYELLERLRKEGFSRVRVDGAIVNLSDEIRLEKYKVHTIDLVVDRIEVNAKERKRIADSIEFALKYSRGEVIIQNAQTLKDIFYNTNLSCGTCGFSLPELQPRIFSFNSPYGACPACKGLGFKPEFDPNLVIPDKGRSIQDGAIEVLRRGSKGFNMYYRSLLRSLADELGFDMETPFKDLPARVQKTIMQGNPNIVVWDKPFEGILPMLERVFNDTDSDYFKEELSAFMSKHPCPECEGRRLKKESLSVFISVSPMSEVTAEGECRSGTSPHKSVPQTSLASACGGSSEGKTIWDIMRMPIDVCEVFFSKLRFDGHQQQIAHPIIKEIRQRLSFCKEVGVGYLTMDRLSATLSGGETQRIKLATQLGSALSGVLYVLDEPTIGLHPRDDQKLIATLKYLRNLNNTVIVVEHDEKMIKESDWVVELGPRAGRDGGKIVFTGTVDELMKAPTLTGEYLSGKRKVQACPRRPYQNSKKLVVRGARCHNLKNIDVEIPLGLFVVVTGVSGSGKSSLVDDVLYRSLYRQVYSTTLADIGEHSKIEGMEEIDKVIMVDQSPIGRTPRSNPATYTGVFTYIRDLFSNLPEAKVRGFTPSRFSFNVKEGRCPECRGEGLKKIEMHFLPDVYVSCHVCSGRRYNAQTLEVTYKGKSIADVLEMSVQEALPLFENITTIREILRTLIDVGLGYVSLGQFATTLSGGEAQRVKLSSQLRKRQTGKTLYILDEPTVGLHFEDVKKLLEVLTRLVDKGNTVLVIEHNLDVIQCADYIIDLGPEGGEKGGQIIGTGSPEEIIKIPQSYTGKFLKEKLRNNSANDRK